MIHRARPALAFLAAVALTACAAGDRPPGEAGTSIAAAPGASAYLDAATHERLADAAPAAPVSGSPEESADRALSTRYTTLEDTDRWRLAQTHAELRPALAMQHFDCPLGTRLSQAPPPALLRLMSRASRDAGAAAALARARGFRPRPIADDALRRPCIRIDEELRVSAGHPSGQAAVGALWGLIFADLVPAQADELRRRGEEIGFSGAICALHYPADVAAGQALASSLYQAIAREPAYQADLAAARAEIDRARTLGRTNPACAAERRALALS